MSVMKIAGAALAAVLLASPALAMTITNRDASPHTVMIQKGEDESEHALDAGAVLEDACEEGCMVRLGESGEDVAAQAEDQFVIQDGALQREE